jgi:hypothetical protein
MLVVVNLGSGPLSGGCRGERFRGEHCNRYAQHRNTRSYGHEAHSFNSNIGTASSEGQRALELSIKFTVGSGYS